MALPGESMKDRWGNDVTPLCYLDEAIAGDGAGQCSQWHKCPNNYPGCYADLKRMRWKKMVEEHHLKTKI